MEVQTFLIVTLLKYMKVISNRCK